MAPSLQSFVKARPARLAYALGWITEGQSASDRAACKERRLRSLQTCRSFFLYERPRFDPPRGSGAYLPELAARLKNGPNLTGQAQSCARKSAEPKYRRNREGRP